MRVAKVEMGVCVCVCVWGGGDLYNRSLYNVKMIPKCEDLCALRVALCVCVWGGGGDLYNRSLYNVKMIPKM